jgi:hypothetical protein
MLASSKKTVMMRWRSGSSRDASADEMLYPSRRRTSLGEES